MNFEDFVLNTVEGITTANYNLLGTLLGLVALIFWLVVISWIWVDAGERTTSRGTRIFYTAMGIIPIFGWIIYLIVRPSETIDEIYWGDLERRYLKYETAELGDCPKCGTSLLPGYIYCPNCRYELKHKCSQCGVYMDVGNKFCTNCGNQLKARAIKEELPDVEFKQESIKENKEEAHESVKAKKSKYKVELNFVSKIGESIIDGYKLLGSKISSIFKKDENIKDEVEENSQSNETKEPVKDDVKKKKKKKNKKKRKK